MSLTETITLGSLHAGTALDRLVRSFRRDQRGQITILFASAAVAIFAGLGAGMDLATAYAARQRLSEVATLACQYSTRPSVGQTSASNYSGSNGFANYVAAVNAFAASSLTRQHWNSSIVPTGASGTAGAYFTATAAAGGSPGSAAAATPTNPVVEMYAAVPTSFSQILNIPSITVHAKINCQTLANTPQIVNPPTILKEGFETGCPSICASNPSGGGALLSTPTNTFPATAGYVGYNGFSWYIVGYCLEIDSSSATGSTPPEGTHSAELDCQAANNVSAGNSSISSKMYLEVGQYELRYNFKSRVDYPNYDPTYICGSTAADLSWANDTNSIGTEYNSSQPATALRTNQINVYLDANIAGTNGTVGSAPLHQTIDGTQYLAGSNLIDMCVYGPSWLERSVRVKVTTPGYYWLSFAADGANDAQGGQLDNIRFCQETCPGTVQDNFPSAWLAANNVNKVLFEDTFESPTYTQDPYVSSAHAKGGNLTSSLGTSGTASSGWPSQSSSGWAVAPYNEVVYWMQGSPQGNQYISLQGWNGFSNSSDPLNRSISRPFLLDPGYYNISYYYTAMEDFGYDFVFGASCYYLSTSNYSYNNAPGSSYSLTLFGKKNGYNYDETSTLYNQYLATNVLQTYMSSGQLISTPIVNSTLGGAVTYNNPDGSVTSSPTVAPDNGTNFASYSASAVNPVIDACIFSYGHGWLLRSTNVKITKPGIYWLTMSAQGDPLTGLGAGPAIDDVKLTALGSAYTSNPPTSSLFTIPVPSPQPDTSYTPSTYDGFSIVADPLTPPGADQ